MSDSDEVGAVSGDTSDPIRSEREATIDRLNQVVDHAEKVFGDGRIRDEKKERIRIRYLNTIVSAANAKRALLKDKDLDELEERIAELEENRERAKYR